MTKQPGPGQADNDAGDRQLGYGGEAVAYQRPEQEIPDDRVNPVGKMVMA